MVDKGERVEIVGGRKGKGVVGTVFWLGDDKYKEGGKRVGIHGDDGETYWVSADYVELSDAPVPEPEGPQPQKGDRVAYVQGEEEGEGEIFWVGESKSGPGLRVGVRCDDGETRWLDAHLVTLLADGSLAPPTAAAAAAEEPQWDEDDPLF